jgi:hypothetical protein
MTVTISRLYDNYTDAQRAVANLEAAGVPHSDLSTAARRSIATATVSMTGRKAPPLAQALARVSAARLGCLLVWVCWLSRA